MSFLTNGDFNTKIFDYDCDIECIRRNIGNNDLIGFYLRLADF